MEAQMTLANALNPRILQPGDIDPNWRWDRHLPALGHTAVDFERRVDHDRLRRYRLSRTKEALKKSNCGALLTFDVNNIRYISGTKIGEWERDKMCHFALLAGDKVPYVWDFGSAAVHHREYCDWLDPDRMRAGVVGMLGTISPAFGLMKCYADEIFGLLKKAGVVELSYAGQLQCPYLGLWFPFLGSAHRALLIVLDIFYKNKPGKKHYMRPMPNTNIINYCHNFCLEVGFRIGTYGWSIERASVSEEVRRGIDRALINKMHDFT